ncbi:hypothetical protein EMIT0158MI4_40371 [Burkholderia ambifaria]
MAGPLSRERLRRAILLGEQGREIEAPKAMASGAGHNSPRRAQPAPAPIWCSADCAFMTRGGTMFDWRARSRRVDAAERAVAAPSWCVMAHERARGGAKRGESSG